MNGIVKIDNLGSKAEFFCPPGHQAMALWILGYRVVTAQGSSDQVVRAAFFTPQGALIEIESS